MDKAACSEVSSERKRKQTMTPIDQIYENPKTSTMAVRSEPPLVINKGPVHDGVIETVPEPLHTFMPEDRRTKAQRRRQLTAGMLNHTVVLPEYSGRRQVIPCVDIMRQSKPPGAGSAPMQTILEHQEGINVQPGLICPNVPVALSTPRRGILVHPLNQDHLEDERVSELGECSVPASTACHTKRQKKRQAASLTGCLSGVNIGLRPKRKNCTVSTTEANYSDMFQRADDHPSHRSTRQRIFKEHKPSAPQIKVRRKGLRAAIGRMNVPDTSNVMSRPTICVECGALKFALEPPGFCCSAGEVCIGSNETPPELTRLFTSTKDEDAIHFRTYARLYNNLFAFTSLGGTHSSEKKQGIYVYKVHGQMHHYMPDLIPSPDKPQYLQLYFYDKEHEKEERLKVYTSLQESIIDILMDATKKNPYAKFFRTLSEVDITDDSKIVLTADPVLDQRVFNKPQTKEIAAVITEDHGSNLTTGPHILIYGKSDKPHRIKHYYGCYDPLQYPLLFPEGDCGWFNGLKRSKPRHTNKKQKKKTVPDPEISHVYNEAVQEEHPTSRINLDQVDDEAVEKLLSEESQKSECRKKEDKTIACREYYCFKVQIRPGNIIIRAGRIFQQYIVDMYVKIENTRLDFLRQNQALIRADLYQGIMDTLHAGETKAGNVGCRVVLPPSFIGGPRDLKRRYLNSMALVGRYGKPDLFITMTSNPNWPEIKEQLEKGEKTEDRPDVVARVFQSKLLLLKKQILDKKIFGEVAALIHVVEFQKRGLPHAHLLVILKSRYKIRTVDQFDAYVCAEIPDVSEPHLRAIVLRHMMHGPCGKANPNCACMRDKQGRRVCKSGYPKEFREATTAGDDCYPNYRRRNTGKKVKVRGKQQDNRWVIPYNPYLLAMFNCHINVEICSTIKAVKYLYKYVYKGHDRVAFDVVPGDQPVVIDEIERYQSGRWISPPEAAWRIFKFDLFGIYPTVLPLQVHVPNMQYVHFRTDRTLEGIVNDPKYQKTMLLEFFRLNAERPDGPKYLFSEFPEHFVWNANKKTWTDRQKGISIGRLAFAAPGDGERFYLRLLLMHVRGPTSFEDLLTVDGCRYSTFQESCLKRGLLEPDDFIDQCMADGQHLAMPSSLRRLFALILIFHSPNSPQAVWDKYYTSLSEDHRFKHPHDEHKVLQLTAKDVEAILESMGKNFAQFHLEHLQDVQDKQVRANREVDDALAAEVPFEFIGSHKKLNTEQRMAYKAIIKCVKERKAGAYFIDGPGGTGKTYLYCALYAKVRSMGLICVPTATSGIAASNMPNGRTAHSRFKIPLDEGCTNTCNIPKQSSAAVLLRQCALIIWDEASMARKENVEALDKLLQDLCSSTEPFGGKIVVFGGDFRQVLPVVPGKTQRETVKSSIVCSYLWPELVKFTLSENLRARSDPEFSQFLLKLGNGELQTEQGALVDVPPQIMLSQKGACGKITDLVDFVYHEMGDPQFDPSIFTHRAILTPTNEDVDIINQMLIDKFPGSSVVYHSYDSGVDGSHSAYPIEFYNTLCPSGMSPHELILKKDCPVILLRNLDPSSGLCNGTKLICKEFSRNVIQCEIASGHYKGNQVFLPRITLKPSSSANYPFHFQRKQFPIKLSFAMTVNKSQGQTLERVGVYLPRSCFSHGQLYVALSRVREMASIKIFVDDPTEIKKGKINMVRNVVSFEVLRRGGIITYKTKNDPGSAKKPK